LVILWEAAIANKKLIFGRIGIEGAVNVSIAVNTIES
jgi:hypothetical protein